MPEIDLLSGKIAKLEFKEPSGGEKALLTEALDNLLEELIKADAEIAESFEANRSFYEYVMGVAKGYFDKPYGGLKASSGQFGSILIRPQDFYYMSTTQYNDWKRDLTAGSASNLFGGGSGDPIEASTTSEKKSVIAFHKLLSYHPSPAIQSILWTVNRFPYPVYSLEPFCKIPKAHKTLKLLPIPAKVILHPGGQLYATAYPEQSVEVEIAPLGLVFAEYDYLIDTDIHYLS